MSLLECIADQTADGMVRLADLISAGLAWREAEIRKDGQHVRMSGPATMISLRIIDLDTDDESDPADRGDAAATLKLGADRLPSSSDCLGSTRIAREPEGVYVIRDGQTLGVPWYSAVARVDLSTTLRSAIAADQARVVLGWGLCVQPGALQRRPQLVELREPPSLVGSISGRIAVPDTAGGVELLSASDVRVGWVVQNVDAVPIALQWDTGPATAGAASIELAVGSDPICSDGCMPVGSSLHAIGVGGPGVAAVTEAVR